VVVTTDLVKLVLAGVKTEFDAAYSQAQQTAEWMQVATEIPTNLPTQNYAWLGSMPKMEEFFDRVRLQEMREMNYTLTDKLYKAGLGIKRTALEDEQYGLLKLRAQGMAQEAVRHWNELAFLGLALGATSLCYDGQYFFDTDHSEGDSGTQSNKTTSAFSDSTLQTALAAMRVFKDDKGKPLHIIPDTLVVGPKNERYASDLLGSDTVVVKPGDGTAGSGATAATNYNNFWRGKMRLVVSPYLDGTYDDYWFVLDTSKTVKPIIIQNRQDVPITVEDDFDEASAKIKEEYQVTLRGRYVQGYGLWQTAYAGIL
jgi:phage major head subunit gpT-like protein